MNYYEAVQLPDINLSTACEELFKLEKIMKPRYSGAKDWISTDLVKEYTPQRILKVCPYICGWLFGTRYKTVYAAILKSKGYIDWHSDQMHKTMSKTINFYLHCDENSFIEFEGGYVWVPREGHAFRFRSDIPHRVLNLSKEDRLMLSLTE